MNNPRLARSFTMGLLGMATGARVGMKLRHGLHLLTIAGFGVAAFLATLLFWPPGRERT